MSFIAKLNDTDIQKRAELRDQLRAFLKDNPENNKLIRKQGKPAEVNDDNEYELYLDWALDNINNRPPLTGYTYTTIESAGLPAQTLIYTAAINALMSEGFRQTRNQMSYSDQGQTVQIFDKAPQLQAWIQQLQAMTEPTINLWKMALNIKTGWGYQYSSLYRRPTRSNWFFI